MAAAPPRVVIVDDHRLFRSGVRAEIGDRVAVVAEADDVGSAVETIERWSPDVVLLDVHLPSGIREREVIEVGRPRASVETRFLALSVSDAADRRHQRWCRAGARGYVTKSISGDDLVEAIIRVSNGDAVFSPSAGRIRARRFRPPATVSVAGAKMPDEDLDRLTRAGTRGSAGIWPAVTPTRRSPAGCRSRSRRWRPTPRRCCASSNCPTATS